MRLAEWLAAFRELHERARRHALSQAERAAYLAGRDELARVMLAAQRLTLKPGLAPRQSLRVARALEIDIDDGTARQRTVTLDVSSGGFATLLARGPSLGGEIAISLRLPAAERIACRARVVDVRPLGGQVRLSVRFLDPTPEQRERLELFVFDAVLAHLAV